MKKSFALLLMFIGIVVLIIPALIVTGICNIKDWAYRLITSRGRNPR